MILTRIGFPRCRPQVEATTCPELKREHVQDTLRGRTAKLARWLPNLAPGQQPAATWQRQSASSWPLSRPFDCAVSSALQTPQCPGPHGYFLAAVHAPVFVAPVHSDRYAPFNRMLQQSERHVRLAVRVAGCLSWI